MLARLHAVPFYSLSNWETGVSEMHNRMKDVSASHSITVDEKRMGLCSLNVECNFDEVNIETMPVSRHVCRSASLQCFGAAANCRLSWIFLSLFLFVGKVMEFFTDYQCDRCLGDGLCWVTMATILDKIVDTSPSPPHSMWVNAQFRSKFVSWPLDCRTNIEPGGGGREKNRFGIVCGLYDVYNWWYFEKWTKLTRVSTHFVRDCTSLDPWFCSAKPCTKPT